MVVTLEGVLPAEHPAVTAIADAESVNGTVPVLQIGARADGDEDLDLLVEVLDMENPMWQPALTAGSLDAGDNGLILAEVAADDLGVEVGDSLRVTVPVRSGATTFSFVETDLVVAGLHESPIRFNAYMDDAALTLLGADGVANVVYADPSPGFTSGDVQRELFNLDAVGSVQKATATADDLDELMSQFVGILQAVAFFVLLLAVLMAFNSASISSGRSSRRSQSERSMTPIANGLPELQPPV